MSASLAPGGLVVRARPGQQALAQDPRQAVDAWARGESTLMELKHYAPDELYAIAQHGYTLFLNGKTRDAQLIFEGLVALDPRSAYYYRALGVIYHRQGDAERAIRLFSNALTVEPDSAAAYVNRAEVYIARGQNPEALADLDRAIRVARNQKSPILRKAVALRQLLLRRQNRLGPGQLGPGNASANLSSP